MAAAYQEGCIMSQDTTATSELTSQYVAQVTADLESNLKEQERINGEIAALQQQLAALQQDHGVLVNIQQALGITQSPDRPAPVADKAAVPAPRRKADDKSGTARDTTKPGKRQRATPKKPAAKKAAAKAGTETAQPTLVELIRRHLTEQTEPRSAAEITTALSQAHPERSMSAKVVRVTLEGLVAKNAAQRAKQGNSVFYTAPEATAPALQNEPADEQSS